MLSKTFGILVSASNEDGAFVTVWEVFPDAVIKRGWIVEIVENEQPWFPPYLDLV